VLRYSASLTSSNARLANFVQQESFTSINVTKDADDWLTDWHFSASPSDDLNKPATQ
jgi:hypothetical protein